MGVSDLGVANVANSINCTYDKLPFSSLGISVGRNMRNVVEWNAVIDRFTKRLTSLKSRLLSIRGRLTVVKAVLGTLPLYYLSLFKAPIKVIDQLETIRRLDFLGFNEGENNIGWLNWKHVLEIKSAGGLGVRSLQTKNFGLLGKWK